MKKLEMLIVILFYKIQVIIFLVKLLVKLNTILFI